MFVKFVVVEFGIEMNGMGVIAGLASALDYLRTVVRSRSHPISGLPGELSRWL